MKLIFICFFTCIVLEGLCKQSNDSLNDKTLWPLSIFKSRVDTIGKTIAVTYPSLGLVSKKNSENIIFSVQNTSILSLCQNGYQYMYQVFNGSFLLISFVKGHSHAAGPETFERDSTYVINLNTGQLKLLSLKNEYLCFSENSMKRKKLSKASSTDTSVYVSIIDIDFDGDILQVVDQFNNHKIKNLIDLKVPYSQNCNN